MRGVPQLGDLPQVPVEGYLTMDQTAKRMGTTRDYLFRLRQLGALLPVGRVDTTLLYREQEVITYIMRHTSLGRTRQRRAEVATAS
jgi:hypothetical protein